MEPFKGRAVLLVVMVLAVVGIPGETQGFDRHAMLEGLVTETILPLHETFLAEAETLTTAALAFDADPTPETLSAVQEAWATASLAFEHVQVFRFRRLMPYITQIDSAPTDTVRIEAALNEAADIPQDFARTVGSSTKGFPAMEYLLFADDALDTLTADTKRRAYVVALADDIQYNAEALVTQWSLTDNYGRRFVDADGELTSVRSSVSMLANEMIAQLEDVARFWIGGPLGYRDGGIIQPQLVEAPYSTLSAAKLIANVEGFQMALNGLGDAPSLADYLDFVGATYEGQPMSVAINEQAERVIAALAVLETPLQVAVVDDPNTVEIAYSEGLLLLQMVKVDMASQLGITVTFNDNDGD